MERRTFLASALGVTVARAQQAGLMGVARITSEWTFTSSLQHGDPFQEVELDVIFDGPGGKHRVPAFWAGGTEWRVRFAAREPGTYRFRTECSNTSDAGLHGRTGTIEAAPYSGSHPLLSHGPLRVAPNKRYLEHSDGAPFYWLGDTWWMGLCRRLQWPGEFQSLAADRLQKGFTVVQIVAGLYPDMPALDERGANEAGFPWEKGFARIRPVYFDMADQRIRYLVNRGLLPCIVGCWGYYLPWLGMDKMKKHWRYIVARWGSLPVVWCLAGEGTMPYYLSTTKEKDAAELKKGWTELARYVRSIDSNRNPITIHPSRSARECVEDESVLDFDMLQTGHSDRQSIPNTVRTVTASYAKEPRMPVVNGEVCYEGILEASREEVQRFMFWASMLSGAAGFTYGANGIWQVNREGAPYGPSPHGRNWGNTPWDVAARLPGSKHLGICKGLLMRYDWWQFEPHTEWVEPHWTDQNYMQPFAAGIPGRLRVLFIPSLWNPPKAVRLEGGSGWRAFYFDPRTGGETALGEVRADESGGWQLPFPPYAGDWVLVMERRQ